MPYGIPWDYPFTIQYYQCFKCYRALGDHYTPYCGTCGAKQPDKAEMESLGLVMAWDRKNPVRRVTDLDDINAFLNEHKGRAAGLWTYGVSHSELQIRLCHSGGPNLTDWRNTAIHCSATSVIRFDRLRWDSNLQVTKVPSDLERGDYVLRDPDAGVFVQCGLLSLYIDLDPGL